MGRVARPSALTPERRERIESELADGIPIAIVAQNVGVGRSTLHVALAELAGQEKRPAADLIAEAREKVRETFPPRSLAVNQD
jgi:hypothetical protein